MTLRKTRQMDMYLAIKELSEEHTDYPISEMCRILDVNRAAYYKWKNHSNSENDELNERIAEKIMRIHDDHPDMGYRRIRDTLEHDFDISVNDKRVLRICRIKKIQSRIKHKYNCCTKPASDPAYIAENVLNREFKSEKLNEKWCTDVTEFKYGVDDASRVARPGATPIFHSDRGYQYTSKEFRQRIVDAHMTQSMSRVAHCTDNGPMEGFWGIMKREMYYGRKFKTKEELIRSIKDYMDYYINQRVQRRLGVLTPIEFHRKKLAQAA